MSVTSCRPEPTPTSITVGEGSPRQARASSVFDSDVASPTSGSDVTRSWNRWICGTSNCSR
jgi:hypothetical protein